MCPVLLLIGEKDVQTLPAENSLRIKGAFTNGKCKNFRVEIIGNVNHLFQPCKIGIISEYARINETFNEGSMEKIPDWILEITS